MEELGTFLSAYLPDRETFDVLLRIAIEHAHPGARYVGLQRAIPGVYDFHLVLFNAPCGSTLGMPLIGLTTELMRQRIAEKEALFASYSEQRAKTAVRLQNAFARHRNLLAPVERKPLLLLPASTDLRPGAAEDQKRQS